MVMHQFLILLILNAILYVVVVWGNIEFMKQQFTSKEFKEIQLHFDDMMQKGEWIRTEDDYKPLYTYPCSGAVGYVSNFCFTSNFNTGKWWKWKPNHGHIHRFSVESFCRIMNGRGLLIVGDSLSEEFYLTILSILWANVLVPKEKANNLTLYSDLRSQQRQKCMTFCPEMDPVCETPEMIQCGDYPPIRVTYIRSIRFSIEYQNDIGSDKVNRGSTFRTDIDHDNEKYADWINLIHKYDPALLIVNAGAHFTRTNDSIMNIEESISFLTRNHPNISVIYRTTSPGHENCQDLFLLDPLKTPPNSSLLFHRGYHWEDFFDQNIAIVDILKRKYPSVFIMDIFNSTSLRIDSHPVRNHDCLHYCLPGPVDTWLDSFYTILWITQSRHSHIHHHLSRKGAFNATHFLWPAVVGYDRDYPDNTIVRERRRQHLYWIKNGTRHYIPSMASLASHNLSLSSIQGISESDMYLIPIGPPLE